MWAAMAAIIAGGWLLRRRYLLPTLPVMYYWLVLGVWTVKCRLQKRDGPILTPRRIQIVVIVLLLLVGASALCYRYRRPVRAQFLLWQSKNRPGGARGSRSDDAAGTEMESVADV